MKRNKKALGIYLWLSWGALLKPSQSSRLFISWTVAILRYLSMCKSKSFRDLPAAFFTLLLVNTQSSSPKRISSIQNNPFHEVCFSGKSSDHWWSPYSKPGLVAQCSLNRVWSALHRSSFWIRRSKNCKNSHGICVSIYTDTQINQVPGQDVHCYSKSSSFETLPWIVELR